MTKVAVEAAIKRLSTIWPMPSEKNQRYEDWLNVYLDALGRFPDEALEQGITTMLRRRTGGWFPKPGEIVEYVEPYLKRREPKHERPIPTSELWTDSVTTLRALMTCHIGFSQPGPFQVISPETGEPMEIDFKTPELRKAMAGLAHRIHDRAMKRTDQLGDWYRREFALMQDDEEW